jgi:hypothetical protein
MIGNTYRNDRASRQRPFRAGRVEPAADMDLAMTANLKRLPVDD